MDDSMMGTAQKGTIEIPTQQAWYEQPMSLDDVRTCITANFLTIKRSFVAIGFYLKKADRDKTYLEGGYSSILEFAKNEYGLSQSVASRYMSICSRFSEGGNSPNLQKRYQDFDKSKLQEMLSLTDEQLEQVTPEMRVEDIRAMNPGREKKSYDIPYFEVEGQLDFETSIPETFPDSMKARPEADVSLPPSSFTIDASDLFLTLESEESVAISQLESREEDILPAEGYSVGSLPQAKESLLYQLAQILVEKRGQMIRAKSFGAIPSDGVITEEIRTLTRQADGEVGLKDGAGAYASAEIIEFFRGSEDLGVCTYARFATQARKAFSEWEAREKLEAETAEGKPAVIDADFSEVDEPDDEELTDLQIARQELERANNLLTKCLKDLPDENNVHIRGMKLKVAALASFVCDLEDIENPPPEPEQPKLPTLRNNDQRKEWLENFRNWPVWFEVPEASEVYYRYDLPDGSSIVICEYRRWIEWMERYADENPDKAGEREYLLKPGYHYLYDCLTNRTMLVEKLKEIQKKG